MQYWIDAYNLLFHLSLDERSLELDRQELIEFLAENYSSYSILLIFDAHHQKDETLHITDYKNLSIVFTPQNLTADSYILERLSYQKNPKVITIVSSDNLLIKEAKSLGAKSKDLNSFLKPLAKQKAPAVQKPHLETDTEFERLLKIFEERDPS